MSIECATKTTVIVCHGERLLKLSRYGNDVVIDCWDQNGRFNFRLNGMMDEKANLVDEITPVLAVLTPPEPTR